MLEKKITSNMSLPCSGVCYMYERVLFRRLVVFFFFVICFIFFFTTHYTTYKTLGTIFASRYLQYILTLTITWFFVFFLHVYITLNYLQNTYSLFGKKKIIINNSHFHTRAYAYTTYTHTHTRTQTLQHHTRLTLVLVCSNLLRTTDMQNAVIRYASYRSMFFRNLPHFAV